MFFAVNAVMASVSSSSSSEPEGAASHGDTARPESVANGGVGRGGLAICYTLGKPKVCLLYNGRSVDESPQTEESWADPEDAKLPWKNYDKKQNSAGDTVRVPAGKLCLICFNVYRALGILVGCNFFFGLLFEKGHRPRCRSISYVDGFESRVQSRPKAGLEPSLLFACKFAVLVCDLFFAVAF